MIAKIHTESNIAENAKFLSCMVEQIAKVGNDYLNIFSFHDSTTAEEATGNETSFLLM